MAKKINGITIAINSDTSGVTSGLKELTTESISLSKQLKSVQALLDMEPGNADTLALQQELLAKSIEATRKKLEALKATQEDVKAAVARGDIGTDEYIAFQRELVQTEKRLGDLEKQADDTGDEVDNMGDDAKKAGNDMQKAEQESGKFGETLKTVVAGGAKLAVAGITAMAAAATSAVASVAKATAETAEYGDNIDKMSQKLGMSSDAYQEWDFIMQHSGSDIDKMTTSMKTLADAVQDPSADAAAAFERLGISLEQAKQMSQEDLFATTISALQNLESGTERTSLATDLLGKSAMDLGALLNTSAEDTEAMRQQVHELGGVMDESAVKTAAAYQDSLQNVKTVIGGIKREIGTSFQPSIIKMMDSVSQVAAGNMDAVQGVEEGLDDFLENFVDLVDNIAETAEKFIPIIIDAVSKTLPKLMNSGMTIIKTLVDAIIKNIPQLANTATKIILELASGLADSLPTLIPQIIGIIKEIVHILTDPNNLDALIDAAIAILTELSAALIDSAPELIDAAFELVTKLCEYLFDPDNIDKLVTAAFDIIVNLADALVGSLWKIGEAVGQIVKKIVDALGLGDYWDAGVQVIDDFMGGVMDAWNKWSDWWQNIGANIYDALHSESDAMQLPDGEPETEGHYARGGIFTAPTRAIIGENGAEVLLPLENNTHWMDVLASKIGGGGMTIGAINVEVTGIDGAREIGNEIVRRIDEALRNYQINQDRGVGGTGWRT